MEADIYARIRTHGLSASGDRIRAVLRVGLPAVE